MLIHTTPSQITILQIHLKELTAPLAVRGARLSLAHLCKTSLLSLWRLPSHRSRCAKNTSLCWRRSVMSKTRNSLSTRILGSRLRFKARSSYSRYPALLIWQATFSYHSTAPIGSTQSETRLSTMETAGVGTLTILPTKSWRSLSSMKCRKRYVKFVLSTVCAC